MNTEHTNMQSRLFPSIEHIDDVLPHVENWPEFRVIEKDFYTVINYMVSNLDTFMDINNDPHGMVIRRECRGLIFDSETGKLISRPYHKFFNAGEKAETQVNKINLYEPHVILEKLDGSMIRPITTAGGFRLASKAGITDIAEQAEEFIADKPHYSTFINLCISQETTPIFEWCSRKNRIVIDYPEDQLILTAIRYNNTGAYVEHESMKRSASLLNIPVVKAIDGIATQNIHLLVHQIREWDDGEGVVMRFDDGHMVKIKADDYVLRHKSKEAISQEKNVIATIVNDEVDDLIPLLTEEDAKRILAFQKAFWLQVDDTAFEFAEVFNYGDMRYPDRKDFAVKYVQGIGSSVPPKLVPFMFKMRSGTGAREAIIQVIQKSVSSQTKIDENRWLFGNLQWNQPV